MTPETLYARACERTGLDPDGRFLYVTRDRGQLRVELTIDGFRLIAERTGKYKGQAGPEWCGPDGKWLDIWTGSEPPHAARVGILREGFTDPIWGKAIYSEFVQDSEFWRRMPANQLAKCAEAAGFRKAFPAEFSGLYSPDELPPAVPICAGVSRDGDRPEDLQGRRYELESGTLGYKKKTAATEGRGSKEPRAENTQGNPDSGAPVNRLPLSSRTSIIDLRGNPIAAGSEPARQQTTSGTSARSTSDERTAAPVHPVPADALNAGMQTSRSERIPAPLQPFVDAGMSRRNIRACEEFLRGELQAALGPEPGRKTFLQIWSRVPHTFKSKEEARARTIESWCEMWALVERAREGRAAA